MTEEPTIAEFTDLRSKNTIKIYFIGKSLDSILADTKGGKMVGYCPVKYERTLSLEEAKKLDMEYFEIGYLQVTENDCQSFYLGEVED
jgi:hypothetical protein